MIDRESPVPVYYQIQKDLIERINRGEWKVGELMPSESLLIQEYQVSRVTLRQALAELEKDNYIKRYRGKGAFVTGVSPKPFVYKLNYKLVNGNRIANDGDKITAKILDLKYVAPAYPEIMHQLNLPEDDNSAIFLKRIFFLGGKPIAIGRSWLPATLLPGFVEEGLIDNSLSKTLKERYDIVPSTIDDYIEVVRCSQSDSALLKCTMDVPLMLVKGKSALDNDKIVEYSETSWLGDTVRFHFEYKFSENGYQMIN